MSRTVAISSMNTKLTEYYHHRAAEYEAIYHKPERQADLLEATGLLQEIFRGKNVLEIACGTGFWTEKIAQTAQSILATDINESVLEIARNKDYPRRNVRFETADLFSFDPGDKGEALFGGFIWSHIPLETLPDFTKRVGTMVAPGATIVFMDNRYVQGSSTPIAERDTAGNTYQLRRLNNGDTYRVLKNFPDRETFENVLAGKAAGLQFIALSYFWIGIYQTLP